MVLQFNERIANECGIQSAVLLHHITFWVGKNTENGINCRNGKFWTYHSLKDLNEHFPFFGVQQIRTAISKLVDNGYLDTSYYPVHGHSKVTWYTVTDKALSINEPANDECVSSTQECVNSTQECVNSTQENVISTQECVNSTQENVILTQQCVNSTQAMCYFNTVSCYFNTPYNTDIYTDNNKTDINTDTHTDTEADTEADKDTHSLCYPRTQKSKAQVKKSECAEYSPSFNRFWEEYPRKEGKRTAFDVWERLCPNEALIQKIYNSIARAKQSSEWQREGGRYVPAPAKWLNRDGWEDEYSTKISEARQGYITRDYSQYDLDKIGVKFDDLPD